MRAKFFDGSSVRKTAGALALEVVVLVLGLYGALLLDSYRQDRQERVQRRQILVAMREYLQGVANETTESAAETEADLAAPFAAAYARGEMPRPTPILTGASGMGTGVWEAMLAAGGINVLDPRLITAIETYYSVVRHGVTIINRFEEMTRDHILPMMDADIGELYDVRTHRLHRRFEWYPTMLADYAAQLRRLGVESANVVKRIDEQLERMQ